MELSGSSKFRSTSAIAESHGSGPGLQLCMFLIRNGCKYSPAAMDSKRHHGPFQHCGDFFARFWAIPGMLGLEAMHRFGAYQRAPTEAHGEIGPNMAPDMAFMLHLSKQAPTLLSMNHAMHLYSAVSLMQQYYAHQAGTRHRMRPRQQAFGE